MFTLEVLLTENALAQEFLESLQRRYLAEKFFYWFPLSVKAWLDLCRNAAPYKNYSRSYSLIAQHAADIAHHTHQPTLEVVSLGAGQGDKDVLVLEALQAHSAKLYYRPVDSSQALLEMALHRAAAAGVPTRGLKADLGDPRTLETLAASADPPRLYLVLGNSLGVTDPVKTLEGLRSLLRPMDRLLVDAEIFDGRDTMSGYDNPVNRRFAFAPLASLGLEENCDGALIFESQPDARREGLHFVGKHFRAARPLRIPVAGHWIELEAGEKIAMSSSWKYSPAAFRRLLGESGGLQTLRECFSEDERFVLVVAAPTAT